MNHDLMGRVAGIAVVDVVGTLALAVLLGWLVARRLRTRLAPTLLVAIVLTFAFGEAVHLALGISTQMA